MRAQVTSRDTPTFPALKSAFFLALVSEVGISMRMGKGIRAAERLELRAEAARAARSRWQCHRGHGE